MDTAGTWADGEAIKVRGSKKKKKRQTNFKMLKQEDFSPHSSLITWFFPTSSALQTFMANLEKAVLDQWERPPTAVRTKDYYLRFGYLLLHYPGHFLAKESSTGRWAWLYNLTTLHFPKRKMWGAICVQRLLFPSGVQALTRGKKNYPLFGTRCFPTRGKIWVLTKWLAGEKSSFLR